MSDPLYRQELLRLAVDATGAGRLPTACRTGQAFNRACGDRVTVDIAIEDSRISGMAHDTKACVLTQASAAILGGELVGLTREEIVTLRSNVAEMLEGGDPPGAPFDTYAAFDGLSEHKSRHACVLLPFDAVLSAFDASESAEPA
ncbi:MAG: iron-sulfur cluster assembly scaffold protein [Alphaproteobacteria bacterium]|nr:iron-sulfur cluster assembly scaffold protein [Alphaproteobacteria bacterium]